MKEIKRVNFNRFWFYNVLTKAYFPEVKKIIFSFILFVPLMYLTSHITTQLFSHEIISSIADSIFLCLFPCVIYIVIKLKNLNPPLIFDYFLYGCSIWAVISIFYLTKNIGYLLTYRTQIVKMGFAEYFIILFFQLFLDFILVAITAKYFWESIKTGRYQKIKQSTDYSTYNQSSYQDYFDFEDQKKAAGEKGEKDVAFQLSYLPNEYKVFNRTTLYSNNLKSQIDHLVIGPTGIYHIETKNYSGRIIIDTYGQWFRQKYNNETELLENPLGQLERHHQTILDFLEKRQMENFKEYIYSVVVSANIRTIITGHENFPYPIWRVDTLLHNIKNRPFVLSEDQIEKLYETFNSSL